jgi:hypothetical protein
VTLPDLAAIGGIPAPDAGLQQAVVQAALVPAIAFDDFSYSYLSGKYWDAWADDVFQFSLR